MNQLFTSIEVAKIFGVHRSRISKWKKKGIIKPSGYIAGRPRYSADDIAAVATDTPNIQPPKTQSNG